MTARTRWAGIVAGILATAVLLTACSSGSQDSAETASEADFGGADAASAESEDGAAVDGAAAQPGDRSVIVTGSLYITVEDPLAAADQAVDTVQDAGGRVDARSEIAPDEYDGGSAWLTLRIPSDRLDPVVDDLRELGTVDEYSTNSTDVTREVTDLEAQISTLRASTERIEALLVQAEDISDIITLEDELDRRQAELESLEARQRGLDDQVSMSTIDLSLTTEPVVIVDDDPQSFWDGLVAGWDGLVSFTAGVLVVTGVLLPWLALIALIGLVIVLTARAVVSRRARDRAAQPEPAESSPSDRQAEPTRES
ncbi:DUF4349 domain-containing protein [Demequina activiva]|uniref:DUF4349 domain-containing protein n=1 Tax=Demequina activiva TaxID=1582364 RepID=A0A919Q6Y4_9MICO|nr:DUF4349 domain-containing protein [Demequina activiva]GIG54935.1 hypothetical protein Dac01nite_16870 [Demequina activiva]